MAETVPANHAPGWAPAASGETTQTAAGRSAIGVPIHRAAGPDVFVAGEIVSDRYRIAGLLGRGGMGEVYAAHDRVLDVDVALKTVRVELATEPGALERVKREILLARRIAHRNVCKVYDLAMHRGPSGDVPVLSMELLRGETLGARIALRGRLTTAEAGPLVAQMATALAAAHAAGVLHRDFKPCNVMLVPEPGGERAVVTDFGVAHALREVEEVVAGPAVVAAGSGLRFAPTTHAGTPAYMAPEQAAGEALGPAADIYALGVVIFEMLTGELPFLGRTSAETMRMRVGQTAPRLRSRIPDIDRRWDEAVARCLSRHPSDRYAQVEDLVRALAPPPRRRRAITIAAAASVVIGGLVAADQSQWHAVPLPACPAPELPDLYVAAALLPGGNGSAACPFRTLTEALAVSAEKRVIHVAAGRYDADHGEQLPLVVRGATEIRGAGREATIVSGTGVHDPKLTPAAMLIGDAAAEISLSGMTINAGPGASRQRTSGIFCDRGNLTDFASEAPRPNTRIEGVTVGPGFEHGIFVTASEKLGSSGCNLAVSGSYFHGNQRGLFLHSGGVPSGFDVEESVFTSNDKSGIRLWDGARRVRIAHNELASSEYGIYLAKHNKVHEPAIAIEDNSFLELTQAAIRLEYEARVDRLERNYIGWNSGLGIQIVVATDSTPRIRARDNTFQYNRGSVEIVGDHGLARQGMIDFGRPDDPGGNRFVCSHEGERLRPALIVRGAAVPGTSLHFFGNTWDHAPPRRGRGPDTTADVTIIDAPAPAIDLGGAAGGYLCFLR